MILVFSDKFDNHSDYVLSKMIERQISFYRFNIDVESLLVSKIIFKNDNWLLFNGTEWLDINEVKCVWFRRAFVELTLEQEFDQSSDFKIWRNEWEKALLGLYLQFNSKPCLNPLQKSYQTENKFFQLQIAKSIGFNIPETICTNEKQTLFDFAAKHEYVVFKTMEQSVYKDKDGSFKGIFANKIKNTDLEKFSEFGENPIILQNYVEKDYEVRFTVVNKEHFVCKIDSQKSEIAKTDWRRYDIAHTPHSIIKPPIQIEELVNTIMNKFGLVYGAFDFIVTPKGEWFFLEINPMGQYLWIEQLTGLQISNSIIDWLIINSKM